ncbi:MAG: thioesterase family protein [Bacillota bacterium]|nr:thioesterase family protein [Bacillota bacterium]
MYINETKLKVRYVETDKMGIVHHSNYYAWFEVGRGEFVSNSGMSYRALEDRGLMMPLVESHCKYYEGAKYEDEVTIRTWVQELSGVKVVFNYEVIRDSDKKLLAKGDTVQTFVGNEFKIVNIKKKYPDVWEKLESLC